MTREFHWWSGAHALLERDAVPEEELAELARSSRPAVRVAVASRVDVSLETLEALACDPHPDVRAAVAANPIVARSFSVMRILANDDARAVHVALAHNPVVPAAYVRPSLASHPARYTGADRAEARAS